MKAIIAAGGKGSRLRPITWTLNKHLIPLANEPLIFNAINKVTEAGIKEIAINVNPGETEMQKMVGDGSRWGAKITYIEQRGGAVGIGQIVYNAREFIGDDDVLFYLGDNIILGSLKKFVNKFKDEDLDCCLAFSKVPDPTIFGVAAFNKDGSLKEFIEKPEHPPSDLAITGIYLYKMKSHLQAFDHIDRADSHRNEYEITHINDWLLKNGYKVGYEEITGWWKDTGMPKDMIEGNRLLLEDKSDAFFQIDPSAKIDPSASLSGKVRIETGSVIGPGVVIKGPVAIGKNTGISRATIHPGTSIGDEVTITGPEISSSIILEGATLTTKNHITDSIIGKQVEVRDAGGAKRMMLGENSRVEL